MAQERSGLTSSPGSLLRAACLVGALLWAALLYYLSDQPMAVDIQAFEYQDKVLHVFAYFVLGMLIMGALRAGIHTVILPEKNKRDLVKIPGNVKRKLRFITVNNMDEVVPLALEKGKKRGRPVKRKKKR